jgi:hypothetical protein
VTSASRERVSNGDVDNVDVIERLAQALASVLVASIRRGERDRDVETIGAVELTRRAL